MKPLDATQLYLVPESGIKIVGGRTVASANPPWLRIEPIAALSRRKWIRLRYSVGFFDEPVRPLIRFVLASGDTITLPMNGPILGSAEWIGRIPERTVSALISPARRTGPFAFRLESVSSLSRTALVRRALRRPDWLYWALRSRLLNSRREAWQALSFAVCGTPVDRYGAWRDRLNRPLDFGGFDRPQCDWRDGPTFHLLLDLRHGSLDAIAATIASLRGQIYPHWRLYAIAVASTESSLIAAFRQHARSDTRLSESTPQFGTADLHAAGESNLLAILTPGDRLAPYALAVVAEETTRAPSVTLIYTDEDCVTPEGERHSPALKPDWSPVLQQNIRYLGRSVFVRAHCLTETFHAVALDRESALEELARNVPPHTIRHIRRILYTRQAPLAEAAQEAFPPSHRDIADPSPWPTVAVVIPTRDRADLLANCLAGLRDQTDYTSLEIIVVDNGSAQPEAKRLLRQLAAAPGTKVLHRPGPFNFSALSNDGARATTGRVLLFLNNDIVMLDSGWLKAMVRWATRPEIGVVGAKLLFPDGTIQHAGVVLGFGGIAGHVYRRFPNGHPGYLSEAAVPREVAAVTAACIAVERSKFEAVGGFDADNLPVDLNDIDLCLRLAERGLANLWTPEATLVHLQSATRGIDSDPYELYRKEREYFTQRWAHVIQDDPYFHPALSLYAHDVGLA